MPDTAISPGIFVYDNYQSVEKFQGMAEAMRSRGLELNDDYIKVVYFGRSPQRKLCPLH